MTGVENEKRIKTGRRISFVFLSIGAGYDRYGALNNAERQAKQRRQIIAIQRALVHSISSLFPGIICSERGLFCSREKRELERGKWVEWDILAS